MTSSYFDKNFEDLKIFLKLKDPFACVKQGYCIWPLFVSK